MNLSGILVVAAPSRFDDCIAAAAAMPGVEVHHRDPSTHRFVVVQEAASVEDEMAGLLRLKAVPGVVLAEMVYHYFAGIDGDDESIPGGPARESPAPTVT